MRSLLLILFTLLLSVNSFALPFFLVDSVTNQTKKKKWQDKGIGFGIVQELTQIISDTGLFSSQEIDKEIVSMINKHRELAWIQGQEATMQLPSQDFDIIFKGSVLKIKEKRKKVSIGFIAKYQTILTVKFKLTAIIKDQEFSVSESGKSKKEALSYFLEATDNKIPFNQTMIGSAVSEAANKAAENLIKKLKKENII